MMLRTAMVFGLVILAGCDQFSRQPPVASFLTVEGSAKNTEPQPPNSLPLGSQVFAPFTPEVGNLGRTTVTAPSPVPAGPGWIPPVPPAVP